MTPQQLYKHHEAEKKRQYNNRVLEVEKASFCPLVYSTSGGVGPECKAYHRRVVQLISEKRREGYASVMNYVRTKIMWDLTFAPSHILGWVHLMIPQRSNDDSPPPPGQRFAAN